MNQLLNIKPVMNMSLTELEEFRRMHGIDVSQEKSKTIVLREEVIRGKTWKDKRFTIFLCDFCGKETKKNRNDYYRTQTHYCSPKCKSLAKKSR